MQFLRLAAILSFTALVGACASKGTVPSTPADYSQTPPGYTMGAEGGLAGEGRTLTPEQEEGLTGGGIPEQRVVYFDYDMSNIRDDEKVALDANARYLTGNPNARVRLEGHADERGSREYNLALGERRAKSVQQYFSILGVSPAQTITHSYGEEMPIDPGHTEEAWQQNRRVEIIYETK